MAEPEFENAHSAAADGPSDMALLTFQHPDDVVADLTLSTSEKRSILAAWACDERTVVGHPTLRQLPCGAIVRLYDIQRALLSLDRLARQPAGHRIADRHSGKHRSLARWLTRRRRRPWDDDSDPPPVPAAGRGPIVLSPAA